MILDNIVMKFKEDNDDLDEPALQLLKDANQEYQTLSQEKQVLAEAFMKAECEYEQY